MQETVKKILLALADYANVKDIQDIAPLIGVSSSTIYSWIKRGKIAKPNKILGKWPNLREEWLLTGEGDMLSQDQKKSRLRKTHEIYLPGNAEEDESSEHPSNYDMLLMTTRVLESNTVYRSALASNIRAFFQAVQGEEEMKDMRERMVKMMKDIEEMKELMKTMAKLETAEKKEAGNDH